MLILCFAVMKMEKLIVHIIKGLAKEYLLISKQIQ